MISTAIIYDRKKQASGEKEGPLEVRITYARKSYYINTGIRVCAKHWAGAVVNRPDADALNNRLRIIVARVNEKANEYIEQRKPIDVKVIKEYIYDGCKVGSQQDRLLTWIEDQVSTLNVTEGTRRHYELMLERLKSFGRLKSWSDLTVDNIYAWDAWLHGLINVNAKQPSSDNAGEPHCTISEKAVYNYHKCLKAMLNRAKDCGIIDISPYDRLKGKFKKGEDDNMEYLTEEQMRMIVAVHPARGTQLEAARDLFVFQLFTGMAFADTQEFDISQYREVACSGSRDTIAGQWPKDDKGSESGKKQWIYVGERKKTGVAYVSVLLPPVVDVLERHSWKVPKMSNQKYNYTLKTLGAAIGIPRLHSHLARHTFATYMLSRGAKVQNVMRMMGHRRIEQTLKYAKILTKDVQEEYERVANDFNF
jgi:hypothetical protein